MTTGLKRLGRLWRYDPGLLLAYGLTALFLLVFVVWPLARVALEPSLADWRQVFTTPRWQRAAGNTALMLVLSTTSSLLLGTLYAFAVTRARVPGARLFSAVPLFLLLTPPFVSGLAFILLLGRRGLFTYHLLGLETSIYGWHGLWLAQTLSFFPVAYLVLRGAFMAADTSLEQAARGLGAGRWQVLSSVTLPLVTPALLAAALFISIGVLGDFGNPMLVGGRFQVLATAVYTQLTGWASFGTSAALGLILLVPAVLLFAAQQWVQSATQGRYATVGGRSSSLPPPAVAPWLRWSLFALCVLVTLFVVANLGVILMGALTSLWGVDFSLTLEHARYVLSHVGGLGNSLRFAALASVLCTVLAGVVAFLVKRGGVPGRTSLDLATLLPAAIPGTLMGVAFVLAFSQGPLRLTGTGIIIVIGMAVSYLPVGYRVCAAAIDQLRTSLDESAANLGASKLTALATVVAPLTRQALLAAFVFCFVQSVGTLSTVIFLVSFDTPLASVTILNLADQGSWGRAAALAAALIIVTMLALALLFLITGRRFKPFQEFTRAGA
ncbi:MAG: iron ABC transporter permease [Trueperaceae bacterium]